MTGKCPNCSYRVKLRKNGTLGRHTLYSGLAPGINNSYRKLMESKGRVYLDGGGYYCEGTGKFPVETQDAADELYEAAIIYLERNKKPFQPLVTYTYESPVYYISDSAKGWGRFNPLTFLRRLRHI